MRVYVPLLEFNQGKRLSPGTPAPALPHLHTFAVFPRFSEWSFSWSTRRTFASPPATHGVGCYSLALTEPEQPCLGHSVTPPDVTACQRRHIRPAACALQLRTNALVTTGEQIERPPRTVHPTTAKGFALAQRKGKATPEAGYPLPSALRLCRPGDSPPRFCPCVLLPHSRRGASVHVHEHSNRSPKGERDHETHSCRIAGSRQTNNSVIRQRRRIDRRSPSLS